MRIARILPGVAVLNGRVYVVGGEQESLIMANGEIYNPQVGPTGAPARRSVCSGNGLMVIC